MADTDFLTALTRDCLCAKVRKLNRMVTTIYDNGLRELGLTANQLTILAVVGRYGPIPAGKVATALAMEKSTISRNLERMKEKGWLSSAPEPDDQRRLALKLTKTGRELVKSAEPAWGKAQQKVSQLLGEDVAAFLREP